MKKVIIYSTPTCHYCNEAKKYFKEHGVKYTEYDVKADLEKRKEMIEISGQMAVPVIVIDGEGMVGFNVDRLAYALSKKNEEH
jgi:glutaredoxin-like YruB-family protein